MPLRPAGATGGPFLCRHVTSLAPGSRLLEMRWGPSPLWSVRLRLLCSGHRQRQPRPSRRALPSATAMSAAIMARVYPAYVRCVARHVGEVSVWHRPLRNAPPVEHSSQPNAAQRCSLPGPKLSVREEWCELAPIQAALSLCTAGAARTAQIRGRLRRSASCSRSPGQSCNHVQSENLTPDGCRGEARTSSKTPRSCLRFPAVDGVVVGPSEKRLLYRNFFCARLRQTFTA